METKPTPICREHQQPKEWRPTTFDYSEEGISLRVSGIFAWVCPVDGDASYTPETADELQTIVSGLLEQARRARARNAKNTEYVVSITAGEQAKTAA
jgi:hypothetical protein